MSDINLLNKPGIQNNTTDKYEITNVSLEEKKNKQRLEPEIAEVSKKKSNFKKYLLSIVLLIFIIIFTYRSNNISKISSEKNISIAYLLRMVNVDEKTIYLDKIVSARGNINIIIKLISEIEFYDKLELLKKFNYDIKGSNSHGMHYLYIRDNWNKKINKKDSIFRIKQLISDFKGIESDTLKNKIIIVCEYKDLISIIELCEENNLFNNFKFKISKIEGNAYYKFIVEEYD